MSAMDLEREVIRMGDVGVAIDMVDSNLADGKLEQAERAVVILREIFNARNKGCGAASTEVIGMRFAEEGTQQGEVRGNLQGCGNAAFFVAIERGECRGKFRQAVPAGGGQGRLGRV